MENTRLVRIYVKNCRELSQGKYDCDLDTRLLSDAIAVSMKTATFRNNQYNIFTSGIKENSTFTFLVDSNAESVNLPEDGFYTTTEVLDEIKADIQTKITLHAPSATLDTIKVGKYSKKVEITVSGAEMKYDGVGTLNQTLGNTVDSGAVSSGTKYTFNNYANLGGLHSCTFSLKSKSPKTILNATAEKHRYTNSLGVVPVDVGFGLLQTYNQNDIMGSRVIFSFPEELTKPQISVRDVNGELLGDNINDILLEIMVWFST